MQSCMQISILSSVQLADGFRVLLALLVILLSSLATLLKVFLNTNPPLRTLTIHKILMATPAITQLVHLSLRTCSPNSSSPNNSRSHSHNLSVDLPAQAHLLKP